MTSPDYILKKFSENPDFRFYDILTANNTLVETCDNESLTNEQAFEKLKDCFANLSGTYIVKIRTKARKQLNAGGDVKSGVFQYTTNLGGGSNNSNGAINGIGYLEQATNERIGAIEQRFQHQLEMMKKDQEIDQLKQKLKAKNDDGGLSGMDQMVAMGLMKSLGIDMGGMMNNAAPMAVNGIAENNSSDNETRIIAAIDNLSAINPEFVSLLENLAITLKNNPEMIEKLNKFFQLTGSGQPLMQAFQVFM